ncbi:MAG: hypothetical protein PHV77_04810 [Candidatus Omnitrophica bacterium]|nr:hypothetical protein [Candidatus Omnitrophota bacterium]
MRNTLLIIAGMMLFIMVFVSPVFAAVSVSVSGGAWAIGTIGPESVSISDSDKWTVTNNSGAAEYIYISVASTGSWTASTDGTQTANQFVLREDDASGNLISSTAYVLKGESFANNETYSFGLYFKAPPEGSEEGSHTLTITLTASTFACGSLMTVIHTAGSVAPVTKTVNYGTVLTSLTGTEQCWITQNLGATQQATSATDTTEASAGWYWQFNRPQGYKHDGTTRTPSTGFITGTINQDSDWTTANDPCALLLGSGWRLPTSTEWTNADSTGGWTNYTTAYASVLKLHRAGCLVRADGSLGAVGTYGYYHSSNQYSDTYEYFLFIQTTTACEMYTTYKSNAFTARCLKDI